MAKRTSGDTVKDDSPPLALGNPATAAATRKQKMMFKKLVMRRKAMSTPLEKDNQKTIQGEPEPVEENPRSFFSKFFEEKESTKEKFDYTDSVSCRSRLRTALEETTTHRRSISFLMENKEEDNDIYQKSSSSTASMSVSESDMSVRSGDEWASYYREKRLRRSNQKSSSVKKLLRRRRYRGLSSSVTTAPARMIPSRIDEMGFATFA